MVAQAHGGALLSGGKPGNPGHNQHTARERAQEVRAGLVAELEGAAKDLSALLETARESDGDRLRCKNCGSFIPGISKLKLGDILSVIRELRAILPAQYEHEGLPPIQVNVVAVGRLCPTGGSKADEGLRFSTGVWRSEPRRHGGVKCWARLNRRY